MNKELSQYNPELSLKTMKDLNHLRSLAQDRKHWNFMMRGIVEVAEASFSDDQEAKSY